jgi:two-component system, LytTR family, sensor kinase
MSVQFIPGFTQFIHCGLQLLLRQLSKCKKVGILQAVMKIALPKYTSKDYVVLAMVLLPYTIITNSIAFGTQYFSSITFFLLATLVTAIAYAFYFTLCGAVAVLLKYRFPLPHQVTRRLTFIILTLLLMSGLFLLLLFRVFEQLSFLKFHFDENSFVWAYFVLGIANIFLTFLHEGIDRYESWKVSQEEMEQLKKTYSRGRLQGLKSQVNPHFLFNSLNSLSSLISEDEEQAEKFLDEMSKVYRYMLRNDEEPLVTLDTEMKFVASYTYLLKTRYGDGLQVKLDIDESEREKMLPPLSLQTIIENAITQNTISKSAPLQISIAAKGNDILEVINTLQPKQITAELDTESGLDNLVNKYELLNEQAVVIKDTATQRLIQLPLILKKEEVAV